MKTKNVRTSSKLRELKMIKLKIGEQQDESVNPGNCFCFEQQNKNQKKIEK